MGQQGSSEEHKKNCCTGCITRESKEDFYDSDEEKGVEDTGRIHPDFKEKIKANSQACRVKKKRRCHQDPWCTIIFVLFCGGMIAIAVLAIKNGDPSRLYMPTDYTGRVCGRDNSKVPSGVLKLPNDVDCRQTSTNKTASALCEAKVTPLKEDLSDRPYLWFMDISEGVTYGGVCVSYCPGIKSKSNDTTVAESVRFCPPELYQNETLKLLGFSGFPYCSFKRLDHEVYFPPTSQTQMLESLLTYNPFLNRCIPQLKFLNGTLSDQVTGIFKGSQVEAIVNEANDAARTLWGDIANSWRILIIIACASLAISFAFLLLIRIFTAIMVWVIVIACGVCLGGLSGFLIWQGYTTWKEVAAKNLSQTLPQVIFYIGIGLAVLTVIYILVVLLTILKIRRAVGIIQEACKAVGTIPTLVFVPVITALICVAFLVYWVIIAVYLWSSGYPTVSSASFAVRYTFDNTLRGIFAYHIFGLLWICNFFVAFEFTTISGAIASWYWRRDKRFRLKDPVIESFFRTLIFQTGSVLFGSLIVAIIQFIRLAFERIYRNAKKAADNNKIVAGLAWAVRIFLFLFELLIKYINKHAYIQMAMYGTSFFFSARNAFLLMTRNIIQLGIVDTISAIILMLGRVTVAFATALLSYGLCKIPALVEGGQAITAPLLVSAVGFVIGLAVSSLFMVVLSCAIDTILQCFLIDMEMCSDDPNRKPYCTSSLKNFIEEARALEKLGNCEIGCCCCIKKDVKEPVDFVDTKSPATTL